MTKHVPNHLFIDLETSAQGNIAQVCATIIQIIADAILNADILFSLYNYERRQDTHPFSIYYKYEQREATPKFHSALYTYNILVSFIDVYGLTDYHNGIPNLAIFDLILIRYK